MLHIFPITPNTLAMLPGIGITCFAGSYTVLLVVELVSLRHDSRLLRLVKWGCAGAGFFAHTAYLFYHVFGPPGSPLSSQRNWLLILAWLLIAVYLRFSASRPRNAFGPFMLPLVLGIILAAAYWADPTPIDSNVARRGWALLHGVSLLAMAVVSSFGFVTGLMFLEQSRRLKQKRPLLGSGRLPSLEWLQRANSRSLAAIMILLAVGVLSGASLNYFEYGKSPERLTWSDPIVFGSVSLLIWLVAMFMFAQFYRPMRDGRRVAIQTLLCFVFLVLVLGGGLLLNTRHWHAPIRDPEEKAAEREQEEDNAEIDTKSDPGTANSFARRGRYE